jgi:hypothetical protein
MPTIKVKSFAKTVSVPGALTVPLSYVPELLLLLSLSSLSFSSLEQEVITNKLKKALKPKVLKI